MTDDLLHTMVHGIHWKTYKMLLQFELPAGKSLAFQSHSASSISLLSGLVSASRLLSKYLPESSAEMEGEAAKKICVCAPCLDFVKYKL